MHRLTLLAVLVLCGCARDPAAEAAHHRWHAARQLIADRCAGCHLVPGVSEAQGRVGPSLAGINRQQIIAGFFVNTPDQLTRWIEHPQRLLPGNAMPEMALTHEQAMLIADYLYSMDARL